MSHRLKVGVVAIVALGLAVWSSTAFAGNAGGSDGGNTVTVGVSTSSSSPGSSASAAPDGAGSAAVVSCTYTPLTLAGSAGFVLPPGGPTPGEWFLVKCPGSSVIAQWIPSAPIRPSAAAGPAATPSAAAAKAAASIVLPAPSIAVNPAAFSVVNFPTWLSIDRATWHQYRATATVGGVTATALATPENVMWTMGDGGAIECDGPGTPYDPHVAAGLQSTSCAYTYSRSSRGEPSADGNPNDGAYEVIATVTWKVTWTAAGAPGGGNLPSLRTTSRTAVRVEQVESVGVVQ